MLKYVGVLLVGILGMGLFQTGGCLVKDLAYLHAARLNAERPRPAQPPGPVKPVAP